MLLYSTDCLKRNSKMKNKEQHTFPFIERLLDGAEVEWKPLGEVLKRTKGTKITAKQMKTMHKSGAPVKIFAGGKTFAFVDFEDIPEKDINRNPSVIVKSRGIIEFEYYDKPFTHKNEMWSYYSDNKSINIKYVYYYLKHQEAFFQRLGSKMQMPQISLPDTERFKIPIPPLAVQEEIVDILDKFTELEGRKRQYEYYRNQLLSIDVLSKGKLKTDKIRIMTLGELGTFTRGSGLQKKDFTPTGVGCIHYGQIYTHYGTWTTTTLSFVSNETAHRLKHVEHGDIIITNTSENVQDVCKAVVYLGKEQIVTGGHASIFKPSKHIDGKYFAYYTQTIWFAREKRKYAKGTKVIDVSANDLAKIQIPIPPLSEQQRIVSILDKFDTLTTSISEGLPKEIELRRKQYEYYRDRLLSFKH